MGATRWEIVQAPLESPYWVDHLRRIYRRQSFILAYFFRTPLGALYRSVTRGKPLYGLQGRFVGYAGVSCSNWIKKTQAD